MITSAEPTVEQQLSSEDPAAQTENPTRPHEFPAFARTLETLFAESEAVSVVRWTALKEGGLSAEILRGEIEENDHSAIAKVVDESIAQGSTLNKLIPSSSATHVIATPLLETQERLSESTAPSDTASGSTQTLSVVFAERPRSQSLARIRQQQVELAAAYLSIERLSQERPRALPAPSLMESFAGLKSYIVEHRGKAKTYVVATLVLAAIGCCPWKHSVKAKVTCEPAVRRFVSAPFDAKVVDSKVKPGDYVSKDQVLARLDGSDLRSKIAALQAKYDQAVQRQSAALSSVDATQVAIEQLEVQHLKSEIELLQDHQHRLDIRAPISGVVISGDLERAAGATMGVGETIYEIATLENMVAEIAIPESEIYYTENVNSIEISIEALPGERQTTSLERIHPRSEIIENNSVYVGEAQLPNESGLLRPGMKGTATLHVGYRPIGWLLLHKPYDVVRTWVGW